jgi:DNA polymerase III epsilon subunit family exonuclease
MDTNIIPNEWYKLGPFTIFDIETTGMSPVFDRIVEIAAVRIDLDGIESRFHSLINPQCIIAEQLVRVHGITNEMVKECKSFHEVGIEFTTFADGSTLVAHNARFDLSFLQESLYRSGHQTWKGKTLDSIPIIKRSYPGLPSYSLHNLARNFGLEAIGKTHRAYVDVELTLEIFRMSMKRLLRS